MLVNTQTANKLIADVWFARADFAKDHPDKLEALVRGIFDAMEELKKDDRKAECARHMAAGYNIPASDIMNMFADAHSTNWAENFQFFLNQNNPTNFERVWSQAYYLYRRIGAITHQPVSFDKVMDFSIIERLGKEPKYRNQKDEYRTQLAPKAVSQIQAESDEILTNTIVIQFYPNSWDLYKKINHDDDGTVTEVLYDPNVDNVLAEVAKLAGQFGAARIIVEGHTDSSREGQVPASLVKELSLNRANCRSRGTGEQISKWMRTASPRQAWAGTGPPTRTTRKTTRKTAAWRSKCTRPRRSERERRMSDKSDSENCFGNQLRRAQRHGGAQNDDRAGQRAVASSALRRPIPQWAGILLGICVHRYRAGHLVVSHPRRAGRTNLALFVASQPGRNTQSRSVPETLVR